MLHVSPEHLQAQRDAMAARADAEARRWYEHASAAMPERLPSPPPPQPAGLYADYYAQTGLPEAPPLPDEPHAALRARAKESGRIIGLNADEEERHRHLMLLHALMPEPTGDQWLVAVDVVFEAPDQGEALKALEEIRDGHDVDTEERWS